MVLKLFSQEPRFVLGEKDLNVSWYFPPKGMPRPEINVGPAKVTASLPLSERRWRLVDTAEPDRGSSHLRFTLADAAGQQMVVSSSVVAEGSAVRVTFQLPRDAGDAPAVSLKGEVSESLTTVNSLPGTVVVGAHLFIAAEHPASMVTLSGKGFDFQVPLTADKPE